ncbi:MAG: M42 family metallopeptidase [Oscillospiraceae bacterium]|nr:M42 family metallopeptidase [Oscillospiraceae bacterium]MBR1899266.1 M42 family metallopeptidase [Oscillospiraceae bacterium]
MLNDLKRLCALCGISGDEGAVRDFLITEIEACPDILECRTDPLGNLLVHKKGKAPAKRTVLIGAHMDEVGLIVTDILPDGRLSVEPVGGIEPDVVIGRAVQIPAMEGETHAPYLGVIGAEPVHNLSAKQRDEKPDKKLLTVDVGTKDRDATIDLHILPGDSVCYYSEWTELGGGRVASKAIDDRFGCAAMLEMLRGEIAYDTWFAFFVQEEIGLRGSQAAAYTIDPDAALILETTTAADLDGVAGGAAVCRLGGGPVVSFMDRRTIYDKALYRAAFRKAQEMGIPCQTKTRIAGGNDAGSVQMSRGGVQTMAISIPCRYLHAPYTVAQISDMEQSAALAAQMLEVLHTIGEQA